MKVKVFEEVDRERVVKLWRTASKKFLFPIPYNNVIDNLIDSKTFYMLVDDEDNLIGIGGYKFMKRLKEYRIIHLLIAEEYRGKGYSKLLLSHIIDNLPEELNYPVIVYGKQGADNNSYWQQYCSENYMVEERKVCSVIRYEFDIEKFKSKIERK